MIILSFLLMPILYIPVKIFLYFITQKYGKFSYEDFDAAGFSYDKEQDIFYSTTNAWQRNFGYSHLYDVGAPIFQMIIDTEPIRFFYNNKNWLITFWKGQYGMTTGAEIGIYATSQRIVNKKTLYLPVSDTELLDMSFVLYKKGVQIASASAKHWWLAVFKLGMYSRPRELSMNIKLTFPNKEMLEAFLNAFKKLHYKSKYYDAVDNTFLFTFHHPHTHKVWTRFFIADIIRQRYNKRNVKIYNKYLADVIANNNTDGNVIKLEQFVPDILKNKSQKDVISPKKEENTIFLNTNVYSMIKRDNDK